MQQHLHQPLCTNQAQPFLAKRTSVLNVSLALALLAGTSHAMADETKDAKLEAVTVTANRQEENIKDVPVAAFTVAGEKLDVLNSSGQDVRVLASRVPSLNVESSYGRAFPRFYLRGYGNTDFRLNASQPVSLVYDDIVQENAILKGFPMFDLGRVEVLAGPQGSLFGRNTPAGVVKFESAKPILGASDGYASVSYGTFGTSNIEAAISMPLGSTVAARASVLSQHRDNWVHNSIPGQTSAMEGYKDNAARVQLLFQPDASLSALFNVHARDFVGSARLFRANIIQHGSNDLVPGFDIGKVSTDGKNQQNVQSSGANLRVRADLGQVVLSSITGYETVHSFSRGDIDGGFGASFAPPYGPGFIPFPSETANLMHGHHQFSQEFRAESKSNGPLNGQVGVYYFDENYAYDSLGYNSLGGGVQTSKLTDKQKSQSWAVFGSLKYELSKAWDVRGGLRYTSDKKDLVSAAGVGADASNGLAASPSDTKTSFDLSTTYALNNDTKVYGRVATGYRGSSVQPASQFGPMSVAGPETTTSYETGIKADLFDKRARASFDVFYYEVKDLQLTAVGGSSNSNRLLNAKKASGQGFEGSIDAYLTNNLLVTLSGSYNDTELKDPNLVVSGCGGGCTVTNTPAAGAGTYNINGNALPQAPKWITNVTARWTLPSQEYGGEYFVYTDWAYRSKVNFFLYESKEFIGKSLLEGGLRVGYAWADNKYEFAFYGRNITNKIVAVGAIDFNNLTGFVNEPRLWGAQFRAQF
jgi:iron complex outermembrane receptor protein